MIVSTVITSKDLKKCGYTWVCPISDHVCTRFLFVWVEELPSWTGTIRPLEFTVRPDPHQLFGFPPQIRKRADWRPVGQHAGWWDQPRNFEGHCIEALLSPNLCFCTRLTFYMYVVVFSQLDNWNLLAFLRESHQTCDEWQLGSLVVCCKNV